MDPEIFDSFYDSMSTRDKWHMVNKLYKEDDIVATKVRHVLTDIQEEILADIKEGL